MLKILTSSLQYAPAWRARWARYGDDIVDGNDPVAARHSIWTARQVHRQLHRVARVHSIATAPSAHPTRSDPHPLPLSTPPLTQITRTRTRRSICPMWGPMMGPHMILIHDHTRARIATHERIFSPYWAQNQQQFTYIYTYTHIYVSRYIQPYIRTTYRLY